MALDMTMLNKANSGRNWRFAPLAPLPAASVLAAAENAANAICGDLRAIRGAIAGAIARCGAAARPGYTVRDIAQAIRKDWDRSRGILPNCSCWACRRDVR